MRFLRFNLNDEVGSATLEFVVFGVLAGFSILFASQQLLALQNGQFVVQQFSKQIARALVHSSDAVAIESLLEALSQSYSIGAGELRYEIDCQPACQGVTDISPGALIVVRVSYRGSTSETRMRALR